ncbi:MAG: hypothetical protein ICCCNLDF_00380 [Planctomycetes bacterium]|nr:hypothetical protein [Planctomycetota bacterium]
MESAEANNKTGIAIVKMKPGFKLDEAKARELIDKDYTLVSCAQVPAVN